MCFLTLPSRKNESPKKMSMSINHQSLLAVALNEARQGLSENGIPIGAAIFDATGKLLGSGHNRRVQHNDPSAHGETDAFRNAGRQRTYRDKIMVTTLAPCWYCSGLVRQFGFQTLIVGESQNFPGGIDWLREHGVNVIDLNNQECVALLAEYIKKNPAIWHEDIGKD
jgi:cytosine deaminase